MVGYEGFPSVAIGLMAIVVTAGAFWSRGIRQGKLGKREGIPALVVAAGVLLTGVALLLLATTSKRYLDPATFGHLTTGWIVAGGTIATYFLVRGTVL